MSAQYNEQEIIVKFFGNKRNGSLVEIGAADGIDNSHTYFLCVDRGWSAILVEPHPTFFQALHDLYINYEKVLCVQAGILSDKSRAILYMNGQISRFLSSANDILNFKRSKGFEGELEVECVTLNELFESLCVPYDLDFLSIDAEGTDMDVLNSLNWDKWKPQLICVEHSMPRYALDHFMSGKGYALYEANIGNSFYAIKK